MNALRNDKNNLELILQTIKVNFKKFYKFKILLYF